MFYKKAYWLALNMQHTNRAISHGPYHMNFEHVLFKIETLLDS